MTDTIAMKLAGNVDAQKWAQEWVKLMASLSPAQRAEFVVDEGTMIGWFANAIMSGYDDGVRAERKRGFHDQIREIAFQAAGAGSGAVMREAPTVVMPSEDITEMVNTILVEFGIEGYNRGNTP